MTDRALSGEPVPASTGPCREIGQFISKGGCFALHGGDGIDVWLEIDPVPLHMLDEQVEIAGLRYGSDHIWVTSIGPVRGFS